MTFVAPTDPANLMRLAQQMVRQTSQIRALSATGTPVEFVSKRILSSYQTHFREMSHAADDIPLGVSVMKLRTDESSLKLSTALEIIIPTSSSTTAAPQSTAALSPQSPRSLLNVATNPNIPAHPSNLEHCAYCTEPHLKFCPESGLRHEKR